MSNKDIILNNKELERAAKKYGPMMERMKETSRESWEDKAPRLTEDEKRTVQRISRGVFYRNMKETPRRDTFNKIHERIEEEIHEKIRNAIGVIASIEWRLVFGESAANYFKQAGIPQPTYIDGVLPTNDFLNSELFDYVQMFEPVVTLHQHDNYDKFIKDAEQSIVEAEKRRDQGDAYYTDLDKQISYRPEVGTGDALGEE